ncbi:hydrophobin [Schizophyllum commune]
MRFFSVLVLALPALIAATGTPASCSGGGVYCCNKTVDHNDKSIQKQLSLVGVTAGSIHDLVGLTCTPITAIGVGSGAQCSAQSVCCSKSYQNGLVNVNCTPIKIL